MANDKDKIEVVKRIKEEIARLDKASAKAYQDTLKSLDATVANLDAYQKLLDNIKNDVASLDQGFSGILEEIKSINKELQKGNKNTRDVTKSFKDLESIAQKLKYDQQGFNDLSLDQLKKEKSKLKILEDQARSAALQLARDKGITNLANTNLSLLQNISEEELAVLRAAQEGFTVYEATNKLLKERIKEEEEINKKLGITGAILTGISKIPIVGPLLKVNEALDLARTKAKGNSNAFTVMGAALGSVGKSLATSLMDPLATIGLIVAAFKFLLELGFKVDKQVVDLQKSLYLSRAGAEGLRENFQYISKNNQVLVDGLKEQLLSVQNQTEATIQLSNAMGAVGLATNEEIQSQIKLTKQMGFSVEEANNLYVLGRQNQMTSSEVVGEIQKQVKSYQKQTGVLLDVRKITQDVSKITGQLRLQYGNNVQQLAAAVIQANKLGFSLEQTKKITESLLNFEQSIEDELAAELLINRDLNLEQARLLALNGKSAEAAAELANQMGGSAEFSKLNVLQQEQLAKALGMNADELANSILYQENLSNLGEKDQQRLKDQLDYLRSIGAEEQAQQLERAIANGTDIKASMDAIDSQTKFNEAVEKLKDILVDIVDGPAMRLANAISEMLASSTGLYKILGGVATILTTMSVTKLVLGLIQASVAAGTMAASAAFGMSALTLGGAAVAALIGGALIMNGINSAADQAEARAKKPTNSNFASGGIVGGSSLTGDNVKINANSGEMVLNRRQQANLFKMLNNGGGGGGDIQLTANLIMDDKQFALAVAGVEKKYSNLVGSTRQESNRLPQ